jgi:hypothetical protein
VAYLGGGTSSCNRFDLLIEGAILDELDCRKYSCSACDFAYSRFGICALVTIAFSTYVKERFGYSFVYYWKFTGCAFEMHAYLERSACRRVLRAVSQLFLQAQTTRMFVGYWIARFCSSVGGASRFTGLLEEQWYWES